MRYWVAKTGMALCLSSGLLILFISPAALTQNPVLKTRPKEDQEERFNVTHRITMNVQVTDAAGNAVSDLRAEDFALLDNNRPRRIISFHPIDGAAMNDATEVLILLDAVNTPAKLLDEAKAAIFRYLAESRKPLPFLTAFALWSNGHLSSTPASTDRNAIGRAFVKMTKNVHSNACGDDQKPSQPGGSVRKASEGVSLATCRSVHFKDSVSALDGIAQQQLATGGRTLLIWVGSGWPELSAAELEMLDSKQRKAYDEEFMTVLHDLRASQTTVYSIARGDAKPAGNGSSTPGTSHNSDFHVLSVRPRIAIDEYALATGGRILSSGEDLAADLRTCIHDAEWYYSLSFYAPPAQGGSGEPHSLELKIDRPGIEVRTMSSYYTEPR